MSRTGSLAVIAALQAQDVRPALFFEGFFGAVALRLWSGLGDIVWDGVTWTGAGSLLAVSDIEEPSAIVAAGFAVTLSGIPFDLVSAVIDEVQQGDRGRIWVGLLAASGALIGDPVLAASGRMDVPTLRDDASTCTVTVTYEGRLIDLGRAREWRYTHESQQQLEPGDRGFEYVAGLQDKEILWGAPSPVGAPVAAAPSAYVRPKRPAAWNVFGNPDRP